MKNIELISATTRKQNFKVRFFILLLILAGFSPNLNAQTYVYVKHDATGNNDGTSWADAYTSLQDALGVVSPSYSVWVAAGTYTPTNEVGGTGDRFKTFQLINGVKIYGGFAGTEDPNDFDLDDRDFDTNETILSGDLGGGVHVYHVFRHVNLGLNSTAVLDGFTVSGGIADGSDPENKGGGMLNSGSIVADGSSPTIRNCVFTNNEATQGGAIYNSRYSSPVITNTVFDSNTASDIGGAIYLARNTTTFEGCTFQNNSAEATGSNKGGGAVYITTSNSAEGTTFTNCSFIGNTVNKTSSGARGGAIHASVNPGFLTINGSNFQENEAQYGGAVYHSSGNDANRDASEVKISNSIFEQNTAEYGGAIFSERHNTIVTSCIIRGNEAIEQSGGYYGRHGSSIIINSLLSGNKSGKHGGGIYFNNETPEVINTTISGNYAGERGGGISMIGTSTPTINNTIVWGNASPEGNELWICADCTANIDYSLYGDGTGDVFITGGGVVNATNSLHSDPEFFNPVEATDSDTPNTSGIYMIQSSSPAVDAGLNAHLDSFGVTKDLRGGPRIVAGNGDATIDIGAYEYNPTCSSNPPIAGRGTDTDPYIIAEPGNFCWMAQNPAEWNKHFKQITDIDLTGSENLDGGKGLRPIGNSTTRFTGTYDGKGYSISNLTINRPNESHVGLFGVIDGQSGQRVVLQNINLVNVNITGSREVGALVGLAEQFNEITNCHSSGTVKGSRNTGGLVGWGRRTDFLHCSSSADVLLTLAPFALYHGGLIGHINSTSTVKESFATGNVSGRGRVGGLIGAIGWRSLVEDSYARGNVSSEGLTAPMIGGLAGEVWNGGIRRSYSTGLVKITGLSGDYGGLVGLKETDSNFFDENNFWDTETSGVVTSVMGTGKETTEMKSQATFTNTNMEGLDESWDFSGIWNLDPSKNDGYPYLQENSGDCQNPTNGGVIASSQFICSDTTPQPFVSESGASGHTGLLEYQWEISTTSPTFIAIAGTNSDTYTHTGTVTQTTWFRRLARVTCAEDWEDAVSSNAVRVDVIVSSPGDYFRSKIDGNWDELATWESSPDNSTWCAATSIPTSDAASVTINHVVTLAQNATVGNITIAEGTTLDLQNHQLEVTGNWTNNGTLDAGTSTVTFTGSGANMLGGTSLNNFGSLVINKPGGSLTASGSLAVSNLLHVQAGTFNSASSYHDVLIESSGTFVLTEDITVSGDWTNNGTFTHGDQTVNFNGTNDLQTISGSSTTTFWILEVSKGDRERILEVTSLIELAGTTNPLRINSGTFKLSSASAFQPFTSNDGANIPTDGGLWNNGGTINESGHTWSLYGLLRQTSGITNIGSGSGNSLNYYTDSEIIIEGGEVIIAGRLNANSDTQTTSFTMTDGILTVANVGQALTNSASFGITSENSSFTMSDGTIIIVKTNTTTGTPLDYRNNAGTVNVSGGTVQFATSSTGGSPTFIVGGGSNNIFPNLSIVNAGTSTVVQFNTNAILHGSVSLAEFTTLNGNNQNIQVKGNWTNNGTFTPGSGTVELIGTATQALAGSSETVFHGLTIDNAAGVQLENNQSVSNQLTLTNGIIETNTSTLTVLESGNITVGSATSHVSGKLARVYDNTGLKQFPVGKEGNFYPMSLDFTSLIGTSTVTAESFTGGFPGTPPPGTGQVGTRYWNVTQIGASTFTYDITLNGAGLTFIDAPVVLKYDDPNTIAYEATQDVNNYTATGLTSLSDFALGENTCQPPIITDHPSSDSQTLCHNAQADELSVTATGDGLNYKWFKNTTDVNSGGEEVVGINTNTYTPLTDEAGTLYYYVVITGECGTATSTVSGAITVKVPLAVDDPSGETVDTCDFDDKAAMQTDFDTWVEAATVSVTNSIIGAKSPTITDNSADFDADDLFCIGGVFTVTWEVTDECGTVKASAIYFVDAAPAVSYTEPQNDNENSCDFADQAAVDQAFEAWVTAETTRINVGGGCDPQIGTNSDTVNIPEWCIGGPVTVTWTINDLCEVINLTATWTLIPSSPPVINCPPDVTVYISSSDSSAENVELGTVTATYECLIPNIEGVRSDGQALDDPYPVGVTTITWTATDGCGLTDTCTQTVTVIIQSELQLTLFLQGPYNNLTGQMSTTLRFAEQVPTGQPYNVEPWHYNGNESTDPLPTNVVDWVLIEIRSDEQTTVARRAGLLLNDGSVTVSFEGDAQPGEEYFIVAYHRNHMPVMSAHKVPIFGDQVNYDFTSIDNVYQGGAILLPDNRNGAKYGMIAGDINRDGTLKYSGPGNDRVQIIIQMINENTNIFTPVQNGYWFADVNMDNWLNYTLQNNDRGLIISNIHQMTGLPWLTSVYHSVVPGFSAKTDHSQNINKGPVNIRLTKQTDGIAVTLNTTEPIQNGFMDNLQFTLAWYAGDNETAQMLTAYSSGLMLEAQGEPVNINGINYQTFATTAINFLPEFWYQEDLTALWFGTKDSAELIKRLWIAENSVTSHNNTMYYVSIGGIKYTGIISDTEVSAGDLDYAYTIRVFPNPVREKQLNVEFSGVEDQQLTWKLFNAQGRMVAHAGFDIHEQETKTINLERLEPGMYILHIRGNKLFFKEKVVILN